MRRWSRSDAGSATAEFAMLIPALVLLLLVLTGAATIGTGQLQAAEAARAAARELARGEAPAAVLAATRDTLGPGSRAQVDTSRGITKVTVELQLPRAVHFITPRVHATAAARTEGEP